MFFCCTNYFISRENLTVEMFSPSGCRLSKSELEKTSTHKTSFGVIFLSILLGLVLLYFILGPLIMYFVLKKRGLDVLPWKITIINLFWLVVVC
jgi:hypothetical protein